MNPLARNIIIASVVLLWIILIGLYIYTSNNNSPLETQLVYDSQRYVHSAECITTFKEYIPSAFEQKWIDNVKEWQDIVCPTLMGQENEVKQWMYYANSNDLRTLFGQPVDSVLSKYIFENKCGNSSTTVESFIEPFAGIMRHPRFCWDRNYLLDKGYIIIDCNIPKLQPKHAKNYYFDLGASTWSTGAGGASQSWVYQQYKNCGLKFDGIFAWEAAEYAPQRIWSEIPDEVVHIYHWYNIPCTLANNSTNPYVMLQRVATPEDYVVVKMDIDNNPLETGFVKQILGSPILQSLIDEFYFEHHINMEPMTQYWDTHTETEKLVDTFNYFIPLRRAGIKAHSWV